MGALPIRRVIGNGNRCRERRSERSFPHIPSDLVVKSQVIAITEVI